MRCLIKEREKKNGDGKKEYYKKWRPIRERSGSKERKRKEEFVMKFIPYKPYYLPNYIVEKYKLI